MLDTARDVPTPEGIELSLRLTGPAARALAWLIDLVVRIAALAALGTALGLLGKFGMDITLCASGAEALDVCGLQAFDLILMDIVMPEMDGLETLRGLRGDPDGLNRLTPAIALTAKLSDEDIATYMAGGFAGVAGKPINVRELVQHLLRETVRKVLILFVRAHVDERQHRNRRRPLHFRLGCPRLMVATRVIEPQTHGQAERDDGQDDARRRRQLRLAPASFSPDSTAGGNRCCRLRVPSQSRRCRGRFGRLSERRFRRMERIYESIPESR